MAIWSLGEIGFFLRVCVCLLLNLIMFGAELSRSIANPFLLLASLAGGAYILKKQHSSHQIPLLSLSSRLFALALLSPFNPNDKCLLNQSPSLSCSLSFARKTVSEFYFLFFFILHACFLAPSQMYRSHTHNSRGDGGIKERQEIQKDYSYFHGFSR
jgi:hypothetical protein